MSKKLVDWNWYSNGKRVFYKLVTELKQADGRTFEPLNHIWARDKEHVFEMHTWLRSADRDSFRALNELFAKDVNHVFYLGGKIKDADPETFEAFETDFSFFTAYAKDKNHVYHQTYTIGKPSIASGANPDAFRPIGFGYGIDDDSIYFQGYQLRGVDKANWRILRGRHYSRDHRFVYFNGCLIPEADPDSFEALPIGRYARDKNSYYRTGNLCSRDDYIAELRKCFIFTGAVVDAVVIDSESNPVIGRKMTDVTRDQGAILEIECQKLLHRPDVTVQDPPIEGCSLRTTQMLHCDLSQWIGKPWIWFMHPLWKPSSHIITLELGWQDFAPMEDYDQIVALIGELG